MSIKIFFEEIFPYLNKLRLQDLLTDNSYSHLLIKDIEKIIVLDFPIISRIQKSDKLTLSPERYYTLSVDNDDISKAYINLIYKTVFLKPLIVTKDTLIYGIKKDTCISIFLDEKLKNSSGRVTYWREEKSSFIFDLLKSENLINVSPNKIKNIKLDFNYFLIPDEDNWLLFKKEDFNSFEEGIINLKSAYSLKPHLTVYDGLKIDYFRIGEEEIKKLKFKNNFFGVKKNEKNISGKPVFERLHEYFRNQLKGESGSIVGYGDLRDWVRIDLEFEPTVRFLDFERLYFRPYGLSWIREQIRKQVSTVDFHSVVGIESRGFVFMSDITSLSENSDCGAGMVKIRKKGKLSGEVITESYSLEYGSNIVEMQTRLAGGDRPFSDIKVIILDDVLATGGTMNAAVKLVERLGGDVVLISCIVELPELGGRNLVRNGTIKNNYNIKTIFQYSLKDNRLYYSKN